VNIMSIEFTKEDLLKMKQIDNLMATEQDEVGGIIVGNRTRRRY